MLNTSDLKIMVLSDIHLFHDKTPTEHIVNNLIQTIPNNDSMNEIDLIIISGDLFDRAVFLPNGDVWHAHRFIHHLVNVCERYDIVLRVLEGTPSHDWKQSAMVTEIVKERGEKCDAKHISILSIEHIQRFGLDMLYVPDEWGSGCASTFNEVKELLIQHNLEKVDIAVMHGCFNYQFPVNLVGKPDVHDENSYLSITRYLTVIGHYHTSSQFERIYVPGSFDRLKHNEEEPKGHLLITLKPDESFKVEFIENKNAMIYKTFDCTGIAITDIIDNIADFVKDNERQQYIRIRCNKEDPIYHGIRELSNLFPFVKFSISLNKTKLKEKQMADTKDIVKPQAITLENIEQLLRERLQQNYPEIAVNCMAILKEVIHEP